MKKKLLILGGTGFLGFNILKYAIKKNFSIVSVSKTKKPNIGIKDKKNVIFLNLDITYLINMNLIILLMPQVTLTILKIKKSLRNISF